jgi:hypothetical protein
MDDGLDAVAAALAYSTGLGVLAVRVSQSFASVEAETQLKKLPRFPRLMLGAMPSCVIGEGYVDLAGRRHLLDFGDHAESFQRGAFAAGRSGSPIDERTHVGWPRVVPFPTWHFALLEGATTAVAGIPSANGRRWTVLCDLGRADERVDIDLSLPFLPTGIRVTDCPIQLLVDDAGIRQLETTIEGSSSRVEVLGVLPEGVSIDWTRLPRLRR